MNFTKFICLFIAATAAFGGTASAQERVAKKPFKSKSSYLEGGYQRIGDTQLYYRQSSNSIDVIGFYAGYYYGSTYGNGGYRVALRVNDGYSCEIDCLNGTSVDGVTCLPSIEQQGEFARVCYTVTNANSSDVVVSLGTHADVMIGDNDRAPISRRIDTVGNTYGLTMKDGNGAQLCVLFGSGLIGVTSINDFWFGYYGLNRNADNMVGSYYSGDNYMVENGSYDSGMGWCWKDRAIAAGSTVVFSYLIGVGEVNLEPNSSYGVTPDDPEAWNDLSLPHSLTFSGTYESPAGLEGVIDYAVEDSESWQTLTNTLKSGDSFEATLIAKFDPAKPTHQIRFRTRDLVGNTTLLQPIQYSDVSFHTLNGIEDKTYTGDSIYQTNLTCDLEAESYTVTNYRNNVNAGTASFNLEGVFPNSIGRKTYTFAIQPKVIPGTVALAQTSFVYNGQSFTPEWQFTDAGNAKLEKDIDYTSAWTNNRLPGTGTLTITGKGNYAGTLSQDIFIDKAQLTGELYALTLPAEDITYDGQAHGASATKAEGVGEVSISYLKQGEAEASNVQPSEPGEYTISLEIADGTLYYGKSQMEIGKFTIYQFSADEWAVLQTVLPQLKAMGWTKAWDAAQGIKSVSTIPGFVIEKGHVVSVDLKEQNLTGAFPFNLLLLPKLQAVDISGNRLAGDIGTAAYAFAHLKPGMGAGVRDIDLSGNMITGNIGLFANCLPALERLDASGNCLEDVFPMIPATVTSLDLGHQTISRVVPLHLAHLSADSIATKVPSILLYDHANQTYTTDINMSCANADDTWSMTAIYQDQTLAIPYVSEQNSYFGVSGDTLNVTVLKNGVHEGSTFRMALSFDEADANFDGKISILDIQSAILYAFNEYPSDRPFNFTAADTYKDKNRQINIQDVVCSVNILIDEAYENESPDEAMNAKSGRKSKAQNTEASIFVRDGKLILSTSREVAALDIRLDVEGTVKWQFAEMGMMESSKNGRAVAYSLACNAIPVGETVLADVSGQVAVAYAALSDREAREVPVSIDTTQTTVIATLNGSDSKLGKIYNMAGQQTGKAHSGVHIITSNGSAKKMLINK